MTDPPKRILLAGESIYLAAIATVLCQQPGIELVRADETAPDAVLLSLHGDLTPAIAYLEKYPGTPIIALDEQTHTLTTISSANAPANTTQDLVQAIQSGIASTAVVRQS